MMKKLYNLAIVLLFVPLISMATNDIGKYKYEKSKTIKKEFSVNKDASVAINNKYGNVDVVTWNENRVVIVVTITTKGDDEDRVLKKLDDITVDFEASKSEVVATTKIEKTTNNWFNWGSSKNVNFKIDYTVKMPVTNDAKLTNDYGSISLNELKGDADINCDYGKITLGDLHSSNNKINIDYTNSSTIGLMTGGTINADYSKFTIEDAGNIKLNADYTSSSFEKIASLNYNCDYGSLKINRGSSVSGSGDYLTVVFNEISDRVTINADYGSIKIENLKDNFENVTISSSYTGIKIGAPKNSAYSFVLDLDYAGFKYDDDLLEFNKKIVKSTSKYYEGYFKNQTSKSTINIKSDYGGVTLY